MTKLSREIVYSTIVLIVIPLFLVANTLLLVSNTRSDFNIEIQRKADLVNLTVVNASLPYLESNNYQQLEDFLTNLDLDSIAIASLYVVDVTDDGVNIIAASRESPPALEASQEQQVKIATSVNQPVARLDDAVDVSGNPTTAWTVASPIFDDQNHLQAVALSSTATTDADELFSETYTTSLIILAVSVVAVVALLLHHYRLAGYSRLLIKQKEINQTMTDFLSVASHELKAPMSIIKGYLANVIDGTHGNIPKDAKQQLDVALVQTDRLNNLVQDLLNVSRIDQGRIEYQIENVDLAKIINPITNSYHERAKAKDIEIDYQPDESMPLVRADSGRCQEIFTNLIDNAIKYTPKGKVSISHQVTKDMLITKVRDTGLGMSAEERQRLFQRFYRVKNSGTKGINGTGLGLWIIKQYIEQMKGRIEVDSLVGEGTEFTVYLPLKHD